MQLLRANLTFAILFGFNVLVMVSCGTKREKIQPRVTAITESVYTSVTIQPDSLYQAYASVSGILDKNLKEEGDTVQKGMAIAQIINTVPKLNTENARLNLELAKKNYLGNDAVLKGLLERIEAAELQLYNDSLNFNRQRNLWEQNIGSQSQYDNKKLAYELSGNNVRTLRTSYDQTRNDLETKYKQAMNSYKNSANTTRDFAIESKINGTVYALYKNPGEIINTMEPVASVGSSKVFVVEMLVDEVDIVKIQLGQKALITLDAYPAVVFETWINKIYPKKDDRSQTFKIEAAFVTPPDKLYPGLSGEGNIIIQQKEDALVIPKEYLIGNNTVETENGEIEITIGLQNLQDVEVLSGINSSTYLLKPKE
ncbi:efflux RND transporter periplasmic adaptor subunit [uncultured Muriicola sp.]|uniref:efflux RND transporter periplasmic adaptor subunit n=1 Tax=uncultured Muriicola sp. TaxID=1583102 RepID=UPI0026394586|nr:efflux RND transporter periplasmic adaptor subunit [uncultured Muriicola sp.]